MTAPVAERERPFAVVVGIDYPGLAIVRSLAREGVPVVIAETNPQHPFLRTRHGRKHLVPALYGPALVDALDDLGRTFEQKPVLFVSRDDTVETVNDAAERLARHYRFPRPDPALLARLLTKTGFQDLAEAMEAPLPRARVMNGADDLSRLGDLAFPCVVKPVVRTDAYTARFRKAYRAETKEEAEDLCRDMLTVVSPVIVQEWIEGSDGDIFFCLQYRTEDGTVVASFTGRKVRSWPVLTGNTASCVPAPAVDAELRAMTEDFFARVGFHGWCAMEFKRDRRDGAFRMVEPTVGRMDVQVEAATLNGVNLPYAGYAALAGLPVPPPAIVAPVRAWQRDIVADRRSARHPDGAGTGFPPGVRVVDGVWRWSDPLPALFDYGGRALAKLLGNNHDRR